MKPDNEDVFTKILEATLSKKERKAIIEKEKNRIRLVAFLRAKGLLKGLR